MMKKIDGPTPSGGSYATVAYLNDDHESVDEELATTVIISEFDDDGNIINEIFSKKKENKDLTGKYEKINLKENRRGKCKKGTVDESFKCSDGDEAKESRDRMSDFDTMKTSKEMIVYKIKYGKFPVSEKENRDSLYGPESLAVKGYLHELGYDNKPKKVSSKEMDALVKKGSAELWRGVSDPKAKDTFINGDFETRGGMYGTGIYTAYGKAGKEVAEKYSRSELTSNNKTSGSVIRMTLSNNARIIKDKELERIKSDYINNLFEKEISRDEMAKMSFKEFDDAKNFNESLRAKGSLLSEPAIFAALMGYDAIDVPDQQYMILINRSKVVVVNDLPVSKYVEPKENARGKCKKDSYKQGTFECDPAESDTKVEEKKPAKVNPVYEDMKKTFGATSVDLKGIKIEDTKVILSALKEENAYMPIHLDEIGHVPGANAARMTLTRYTQRGPDGNKIVKTTSRLDISARHFKNEKENNEESSLESMIAVREKGLTEIDNARKSMGDKVNYGLLKLRAKISIELNDLIKQKEEGRKFIPNTAAQLFPPGNDRIRNIIFHEAGHYRWDNSLSKDDIQLINNTFLDAAKNDKDDFPSIYSKKNSSEWWSEQYSLFRMGKDAHPIVGKIMNKYKK
jgi:hypothetical protein